MTTKYDWMDEGLTEERTKLAKVTRETKELELAVLRGSVIKKETAKKHIEQIIGAVRSRLLALPKRLAPVLVARTHIPEIQELIEKEVYDALRELSTDRKLFGGNSDDDHRSTPEADSERVGRRKKNVKRGRKRRTRKMANRKG